MDNHISNKTYFRSHTCGELTESNIGESVVLAGWIDSIRTHGGVNFINLRDRYGVTQLVVDDVSNLKPEYVIQVKGVVVKRVNPNPALKTGLIEIKVDSIIVINKSDVLPIDIHGRTNVGDDNILKYRYLYFRNSKNMTPIVFRHRVKITLRKFLNEHGFLELETPLLVKSTPEGARDYLVPSRINKGKFYALPQSPQLYKQILMISGFDRYYQFARCLRDEDLRADRQPEHTQLDLEMSFVSSDDIRFFVESAYRSLFKELLNVDLPTFEVISYADAMSRFGSDKPDMRFGLELHDVTSPAKSSGFNAFDNEYTNLLVVNEIFSRKKIDSFTELVKGVGVKGLAYVKFDNNSFEGGVSKFFNDSFKDFLVKNFNFKNSGTVFFVSGPKRLAQKALGLLRLKLRDELELVLDDDFRFVWVVDFPLFNFNADTNSWEPEHHVFSMPKNHVDDFEKYPSETLGDLWDLVLNGVELGSGSIRVSDPDLQQRLFRFINLSEKDISKRFGFLIRAYRYGAPVHGGMGLGLDRLVALMLGLNDIREVILFPKNKNAESPLDDSPDFVSQEQLDELGLSLK